MAARFHIASVEVRTRVVVAAHVASAILDEAMTQSCDLIAIATHGRGGIKRCALEALLTRYYAVFLNRCSSVEATRTTTTFRLRYRARSPPKPEAPAVSTNNRAVEIGLSRSLAGDVSSGSNPLPRLRRLLLDTCHPSIEEAHPFLHVDIDTVIGHGQVAWAENRGAQLLHIVGSDRVCKDREQILNAQPRRPQPL